MRRHDLLRVEPSAWRVMLDSRPDLAALELLPEWAVRGWPVIVRRWIEGEDEGGTPSALPLPPSLGKRRIAFSLNAACGVTRLPKLALSDAAPIAPAAWRATIDGLIAIGLALTVTPSVFGALLWQYSTGLRYLSPHSDLDLLWRVDEAATASALTEALSRLEAAGPVRLDGELELPGGGSVNWREWAQSARNDGDLLLVKSMAGISLRKVGQLFETIETPR